MKYALLFVLVLSHLSRAQSKVTGLGKYIIGITTPDSLNRTEFSEEEPSYVKGTIALPCTHIRTFTAATVTMAGMSIANVLLVFYDNKLCKLSCDYRDPLKAAFLALHGPGVRQPVSRFGLCAKGNDKPLLIWGESWAGGHILALAVHRKGHTADCKPEESARLILFSQPISALSSECEIKPADPFVEEFLHARMNKLGKPQ